MLGSQPIYLCMDANASEDSSPVLAQALLSRSWFDVARQFSQGSPESTFCSKQNWDRVSSGPGVTRPDFVITNAAGLALIRSYKIRRDLTVKGHLGLELTLDCQRAVDQVRVFRAPGPFNVAKFPSPDDLKAVQTWHSFWSLLEKDFKHALDQADSNTAWMILAKVAEKYMCHYDQASASHCWRHRPPQCDNVFATASGATISLTLRLHIFENLPKCIKPCADWRNCSTNWPDSTKTKLSFGKWRRGSQFVISKDSTCDQRFPPCHAWPLVYMWCLASLWPLPQQSRELSKRNVPSSVCQRGEGS